MSRRAHLHLFAFVLLATGIYAAEVAVVRMRWPWPDLIAIGVMLDLIVMVPAVYWFLAVRRGGYAGRSVRAQERLEERPLRGRPEYRNLVSGA